MAKKFSVTEKKITNLFKKGETVNFKGQNYTIIESGKPSSAGGECKTDTYIMLQNERSETIEIKLSIKQENADFLENKISLERAKQILGPGAQQIIQQSIFGVKSEFENDNLVLFDKKGSTQAKSIKIGWKFEILKRKSGRKSGILQLSKEQLIDVYAGTNTSDDKKNAMINGKQIRNSGVANYIVEINSNRGYTKQDVLNNMVQIDHFVNDKTLFFACKAINYRASKDKWDSNRPLAVAVIWRQMPNAIGARISFENPLGLKANSIGQNIRRILKMNNINKNNFNDLEAKLSSGINYYKSAS